MFDFNTIDPENHYTNVHYACVGPSLNMINDMCGENQGNPLALNKDLKIPSEIVPKQYLTSYKMIKKYERESLKEYYKDPKNFKMDMSVAGDFSKENYTDALKEKIGGKKRNSINFPMSKGKFFMGIFKNNYFHSQRVQTEENVGPVNLFYFPTSKMK